MIELAQMANKANSIQELMTLASQFAAVDPSMIDNMDMDRGFEMIANLKVGEPQLIRSMEALQQIRQQRAQQQQQAAQDAAADRAQKLAAGAKNLSDTNVGGGQNALQSMLQGAA
jgi:hypothetical protein